MKVLILTPEYQGFGGGIMTFYRHLVPALVRQGVDVTVIEGSAFSTSDGVNRRTQDGVTIETLDRKRLDGVQERLSSLARHPWLRRHLAAAWAMWEQAQAHRADVIEASDWGLLFIPPVVDGTRPVIVQFHGSVGQIDENDPMEGQELDGLLTSVLEEGVAAAADCLQTYSEANAACWKHKLERDVSMIRPAWSPPSPGPTRPISDLGLVVGRIQRWKGPDTVCEALALLGDRAPILEWIGRDTIWGTAGKSASEHLRSRYPSVWGNRVLPRTPEPPAEIQRKQASARFNLVPSSWDVFNFTAIEALASGRPTIVSSGAGASELVEDGVNGYVFTAGDPEALRETVSRLISEPEAKLQSVGAAAQASVRRICDPDSVAAARIAKYTHAVRCHETNPRRLRPSVRKVCSLPTADGGQEWRFLWQYPARVLATHTVQRLTSKVQHLFR